MASDVVLKSRRAALRDPPLADCSPIITRGGVPEHRRLADREIGEPDRPVEHRRAPPEADDAETWREFMAINLDSVFFVDGAVLATL